MRFALNYRTAWRVLLSMLWLGCLLLTLLPCLPGTPELDFQCSAVGNLVHTVAWLLAFPGSRYWAARSTSTLTGILWRWLPRLQWGLVVLVMLFPVLGWIALLGFFLFPGETRYVPVLQRGPVVVSYQRNSRFAPAGFGSAPVLVQALSPILQTVRPLPPDFGLDSTWTLLDARGYQLLDPETAQQLRLRAAKYPTGKQIE